MDGVEDRTDRRRKRLERDIERARIRLEATRREEYHSEAVFRRVRTQRRQRVTRLEQWLATLDAAPLAASQERAPIRRGGGCPRCGEPKSQLFGLAGSPVALCYACWADLGNEWSKEHPEANLSTAPVSGAG